MARSPAEEKLSIVNYLCVSWLSDACLGNDVITEDSHTPMRRLLGIPQVTILTKVTMVTKVACGFPFIPALRNTCTSSYKVPIIVTRL
jgi:hypothetical protein